MMMMGLSRNPRRELYTPSPSSAVLSPLFFHPTLRRRAVAVSSSRGRGRTHHRRLFTCTGVSRVRDRDRSSDPSVRHPSDPSDLSIRPIRTRKSGCVAGCTIVLCTSPMYRACTHDGVHRRVMNRAHVHTHTYARRRHDVVEFREAKRRTATRGTGESARAATATATAKGDRVGALNRPRVVSRIASRVVR